MAPAHSAARTARFAAHSPVNRQRGECPELAPLWGAVAGRQAALHKEPRAPSSSPSTSVGDASYEEQALSPLRRSNTPESEAALGQPEHVASGDGGVEGVDASAAEALAWECAQLEEMCRSTQAELRDRREVSAGIARELAWTVARLQGEVAAAAAAEAEAVETRHVVRAEEERLQHRRRELEREVLHLQGGAASAGRARWCQPGSDAHSDGAECLAEVMASIRAAEESEARAASVEASAQEAERRDLRAIADIERALASPEPAEPLEDVLAALRAEEQRITQSAADLRRQAELYERLRLSREVHLEHLADVAADLTSRRLVEEAELATSRQTLRAIREEAGQKTSSLARAAGAAGRAQALRRAMHMAPIVAAWAVSACRLLPITL